MTFCVSLYKRQVYFSINFDIQNLDLARNLWRHKDKQQSQTATTETISMFTEPYEQNLFIYGLYSRTTYLYTPL